MDWLRGGNPWEAQGFMPDRGGILRRESPPSPPSPPSPSSASAQGLAKLQAQQQEVMEDLEARKRAAHSQRATSTTPQTQHASRQQRAVQSHRIAVRPYSWQPQADKLQLSPPAGTLREPPPPGWDSLGQAQREAEAAHELERRRRQEAAEVEQLQQLLYGEPAAGRPTRPPSHRRLPSTPPTARLPVTPPPVTPPVVDYTRTTHAPAERPSWDKGTPTTESYRYHTGGLKAGYSGHVPNHQHHFGSSLLGGSNVVEHHHTRSVAAPRSQRDHAWRMQAERTDATQQLSRRAAASTVGYSGHVPELRSDVAGGYWNPDRYHQR